MPAASPPASPTASCGPPGARPTPEPAIFTEGHEPSPIEPDRVYEYTLSLWDTAPTLGPGERLRVQVTSSCHPRWDRNSPGAGPPGPRAGRRSGFPGTAGPRLTELDARYALETDDGHLIYVHNRALRHGSPEDIGRLNRGEPEAPEAVYFRCAPRFATASAEWDWLNNVIAVGTGQRGPDSVRIAVFTVD
jgi:Protein of unknown function (DUF3237)/X-Pro dipeptidyl-peptidase C-terminal non-catalytic domain